MQSANRNVKAPGGVEDATAPFLALTFVAGVRTFVHARCVIDGQGSGVQGLFEAVGLGFIISVVVLLPGILTHAPRTAVPYVLAYGGED